MVSKGSQFRLTADSAISIAQFRFKTIMSKKIKMLREWR